MISQQQEELASLYAAGALTPSEQQAFEAELNGHPELQSLTRELQSTMAAFATATSQAALPPGLKDKVLRRIEEAESAKAASLLAPLGLRFVLDAGGSGWKPLPVPGTSVKLLSFERERGYAVLLGKLEAGARYPAHHHNGPEDFFILTGDLVVGDRRIVAGDFHHADPGSEHEELYSVQGCTLLAVLPASDPLVAFALS